MGGSRSAYAREYDVICLFSTNATSGKFLEIYFRNFLVNHQREMGKDTTKKSAKNKRHLMETELDGSGPAPKKKEKVYLPRPTRSRQEPLPRMNDSNANLKIPICNAGGKLFGSKELGAKPHYRGKSPHSADVNNNATVVRNSANEAERENSNKMPKGKVRNSVPNKNAKLTPVKAGKARADCQKDNTEKDHHIIGAPDGVLVNVTPSEDEFQDENDNLDDFEDDSDQEVNPSEDESGGDKHDKPEYLDEEELDDSGFPKTRILASKSRKENLRSQLEADPEVQEILEEMAMQKFNDKMSRASKTGKDNPDHTVNTPSAQKSRFQNTLGQVKSPSDTTLYTRALNRAQGPGDDANQMINRISNFVENIRLESERGNTPQRRSGTSFHQRDTARAEAESEARAKAIADKILLEGEQNKADIALPPKGNVEEPVIMAMNSFKAQPQQDADDDFFHVTCHIDTALREKIEKGEFVDLEKLLPRSGGQNE